MRLDNRNKILILGFILTLVASYFLAISKTFELWKDQKNQEEQKVLAQNVFHELDQLSEKESSLDLQFEQMDLEPTILQNSLLHFLNQQGMEHRIKILDFKVPHIIIDGPITTKTYQFTLEGGFPDILKVAHGLEGQGNYGVISHISFEKQQDPKSRNTYLQTTFHLEQIE
ncbi:hypothetical protein [Allomuricauda sp. M10]|uniref:hypothetical protein n=1 Tax=Allomuricauda sp. M10 TaxID=2683292 RepID=UPI001D181398|nr:hypothetical protein [Muricauda sp. M10]